MTRISRISITLPRDLLVAANRRARELDRSRSWVVAEALRTFLTQRGAGGPGGNVREVVQHPYAITPGLGGYRLQQLEADLALTPEERVREAERTAREAELVRGTLPGRGVRLFDRYEDYVEWKRREGI